MVNIKELKAEFTRNDYTQEEIAKLLGTSSRTLSNRLKNRVFWSDEIEKLIKALNIKEPMKIFFDEKVTYKDTTQKQN